jgi:prevent-host-death family protein
MTRTVTATEAKNRLGALLRAVSKEGDAVVIESRRERVAVLISVADYEELQELRKDRQRREGLKALERIAAIQAERNKDLSEEEAQALVDRAIKDIREDRRARARKLMTAQ